ncbi:ATPase [Eubacterium multiforme]|uniref:Vacuolar-type H+-ATPase subunit H n=1 Tax=Eubacterium multiforme TaxID=83339 RepID=A0ABT9UQI0_9FIRM|nr:ATPase [Eubacterium multiforme]MDQ0148908.1 vacuolar-type H+-ATPase subunit H [Eubacterium multiforme]
MDKQEINIIELLEYLQDLVDNSPKVPMSGKTMIDKKEFLSVIDQIINYLPDQFKKAQWVMNERERILAEAKKEYDSVKEETMQLMRQNVENHDIVKEAKIRAQEILASAKRDSKNIRVGARDYADEILSDLDREMEKNKMELIKSLQISFEDTAKEIDENLTKACSIVKENIKELRTMN